MELSFKRAEEQDLPVLLEMMRLYCECDHLPFDEAARSRDAASLLRDPALGGLWLIGDGGSAIGYGALCLGFSLEFGGRDAFIDELFVREEWRGRGVGRWALGRLREACAGLGVRAVHLEVTLGNDRALRLYRSVGFEEHGRTLMTSFSFPAGPAGA